MANERIERFARILESNPGNILARFSLSQAYFDAGQYAEAADHLRRVIVSKSDWMLAYLLLGRALIETGHRAEARPILEKGLELALHQGHEGPQADFREILSTLPQ